MSRRSFVLRTAPRLAWLGVVLLFAVASRAGERPGIWSIPYPERFDLRLLTDSQPRIRVEGNAFVDDSGARFVFRGVSIADPAKVLADGQWRPELFAEIEAWGANTIRLPVHPIAWRELGNESYLELIDEAVVWANRLGLYLIIDWHSIGNLMTEQFQHPIYDTTRRETLGFWRAIAFRYRGVTTVAAYELFNEPTTRKGRLGAATWSEWRTFNEELIDIVYAHDEQAIPMVAGFNWAYDLTPVRDDPLRRPGIAYVVHPYPQKASATPLPPDELIARWQETWGYVSETYPVVASELGWVRADGYGAHSPVIDDGRYGPLIVDYLEARGISWIAWAFDPEWSPVLITDWNYTPSEQGRFFREVMRGAD